jgi:hypothetical protein
LMTTTMTTIRVAVGNVARISSQRKGHSFPDRQEAGSLPPQALHVSLQWAGNERSPTPLTKVGRSRAGRPDNGPAGYSRPQSRSHQATSGGQAVRGGSDGSTGERLRHRDNARRGDLEKSVRRNIPSLIRLTSMAGGWRLAPDKRHRAAKRVRPVVFPRGACLAYPNVDGVARAPLWRVPP